MNKTGNEDILWKAHPTLLVAFTFYLVATLITLGFLSASVYIGLYTTFAGIWYVPLILAGVTVLVMLVKYFLIRTDEYVLTNQRFVKSEGIFDRSTEEIELYRIRDWSVKKPFLLRLFNCGNVEVVSSDATSPLLLIPGIHAPEAFREKLRELVEAARSRHRVRNVEGLGDGDGVDTGAHLGDM